MANFFVAIGHFFKKVFGFVVKSDPFKQFVGALMPFVIQQVEDLANLKDLSNEQKRMEAFRRVRDEARVQGLKFADHFIFLLIETAVAKLKGTIG